MGRTTTRRVYIQRLQGESAATESVLVQERMVNLMADTMVSSTSYMRAYFRQRGWRLPTDTIVIPNVMPSIKEQAGTTPHLQDVRSALQGHPFACRLRSQGIRVM